MKLLTKKKRRQRIINLLNMNNKNIKITNNNTSKGNLINYF